MLTRRTEWATLLTRYVNATQLAPYAFGIHDCAIWTLGAVDVMCGTAYADELRGTYGDLEAARQRLTERWGTFDAAAAAIGRALPSPVLAQRGDIAVMQPNTEAPFTAHRLGSALVQVDGLFWMPTEEDGRIRRVTAEALHRIGGTAYAVGR